jgi:multicomponent Na+:H+ antiporter subunit C
MPELLAIVSAALFAAGFYSLTRRSILALAIGLILLGHATNLVLFTANGLVRGKPPRLLPGESMPPEGFADPLPQALILTAVVINFGMVAFAVVLLSRTRRVAKTDDTDSLRHSE